MPLTKQSFHALFDASPNPYLVLDLKLDIVTANRAYLASTGRALADMAGRSFRDAFPSDPDTMAQMTASLERAIRTGRSDTMALLRYDIPRAEAEGGGFETRFWTITHTPVFDDAGTVEFVMQHPIDVTEIERMRSAARASDEGDETELLAARSGLLSRAQHVYQQNLTLQADVERLNALFQQAPSFMAVLRGPEHVFELVNDALLELMGERDYLGKTVRAAVPELAGQGFFELLDGVHDSGEAFVGRAMPARLRRRQGGQPGQLELRYLDFIYQPIVGPDGQVQGVFLEGTDVTEQVQALAEVEEKVRRLESAERQLAFQLELADSLRPLSSSADIAATATAVLGRRLGVARVLFAHLDPVTRLLGVRGDWSHPEMDSLTGQDLQVGQLGFRIDGDLLAGRPLMVDDAADLAAAGPWCTVDASFGARSHLTVPVIEAGTLRAVLSLHRPLAHHWSGEELRMAQDMAERTWAAVEAANAQRTLRAERDESQTIFDSMIEGFGLLDRDWRLVKMNAAGLKLLGRGGEVLGLDFRDAFANMRGTSIDSLCRHVKASRVADIAEYPYPLADGGVRWLEVRAFPALEDGVALFLRDVTLRRDAQQRLRDTAERLHFILESAELGAWEMDLATGVSRRSLLHDQCFGYGAPVAEWSVEIFLQHVHPDDRAAVAADFHRAIARNEVWQAECRIIWPDGSLHWIAIFGAMHAGADGPGRIAGIVYDISERKAAEEKLRIEGRRKDEFLAMLAHELRNPLAPIGAAAQILSLGEPDAAKVKKTSAIITRQVAHITSLINDLLDVSRVSGGLVRLENAPVDVKDAVADAVEQVRPLVEARGHRLEVHLAAEHTIVQGDRKRLVQVLSNLLNNAAKYTPPHGRIVMQMEMNDDEVVLCVIDDGIGMTPEVQAGVFDLFTQAERTPDRSQGGLGIGLALVRSLVELHGGRVAVHSEGLGRGSKFSVVLPRLRRPAALEPGQSVQPAGQAAAAPLRILVVDDNVDAAQLLAMFLEGAGYRVAAEHDPARALTVAAQEDFDVFLLDIGLPGMDGIELAQRLRRLPQAEHALLVAITGYGSPQDREAALRAGFDHHFVKPAPLDKLLAIFAKRAPVAQL
ncbi:MULTISPECIES: PAS domain-containing protein [unclassified Massilia]|uniref:PAS domain-containing protein n=1 Tax=unclassified Massilia TaxID=2609279 RepID=UPI00177FB4AB|nr:MULTISPECIES: PAS domain-containing protein [unclassified Massilia]MBD8531104.1 PAS domain-containing protein [Massilia sp. CFBP 13647]MBD8674940.1 PAS domain-containing protein [Massilia sp. CFBP 13721]